MRYVCILFNDYKSRIYALSGRKWYLLALLVPIIVIQFGFAMFVVSQKGNGGESVDNFEEKKPD